MASSTSAIIGAAGSVDGGEFSDSITASTLSLHFRSPRSARLQPPPPGAQSTTVVAFPTTANNGDQGGPSPLQQTTEEEDRHHADRRTTRRRGEGEGPLDASQSSFMLPTMNHPPFGATQESTSPEPAAHDEDDDDEDRAVGDDSNPLPALQALGPSYSLRSTGTPLEEDEALAKTVGDATDDLQGTRADSSPSPLANSRVSRRERRSREDYEDDEEPLHNNNYNNTAADASAVSDRDPDAQLFVYSPINNVAGQERRHDRR